MEANLRNVRKATNAFRRRLRKCVPKLLLKKLRLGVKVDVTQTHTHMKNTGGVRQVLRPDSIEDVEVRATRQHRRRQGPRLVSRAPIALYTLPSSLDTEAPSVQQQSLQCVSTRCSSPAQRPLRWYIVLLEICSKMR